MSDSLEEAVAASIKSRRERQAQADAAIIAHLDFEPSDVKMCQRYSLVGTTRVFCDRFADYRMICRKCGLAMLACTRCRDELWETTTRRFCAICKQSAVIRDGWFFQPIVS